MKETVLNFGKEGNLVGVLAPVQSQLPGVVFLNAGLLHKVGPYREWVDLSRRFVKLGFSTFRFDISGLGDSELPSMSLSDVERSRLDIGQALEVFQKKAGVSQFILVGLCSGADYAHPFALQDERIKGLVMIDGYGYQTKQYEKTALREKWLSARRWNNRMLRVLGKRQGGEARAGRKNPETYIRDFAPPAQVRDEIQNMAQRGTHFLFLYTSGAAEYYNYENQFWDMFAPMSPATVNGQVEVEFYPLASHTFTFLEDRERMFQRITNWTKDRAW